MTELVKFLLVDDLDENLTSLEALLRHNGLALFKAKSGEEALELLLVHDFALALLDVHMPGMNGFELAECMRGNERARHIPIIFLTAGNGDSQRLFRGYEVGAVDFIQKPLDVDILRHKATVFFDLYRQRQQIALQRDELAVQAATLQKFDQLTREQLLQEQETARLREQFIAILGHDLRNPLASISGATRLLRRQPQTEGALKIIQLMEGSVTRMTELIDNVADFARGRLGSGIVANRRSVPLEPTLRQVTSELEASHPGRVIICTFALPGQICVDAARIGQMTSNLLANALAYGDPHEPIHLDVKHEAGTLTLSVSNAGPAIPAATMERLFEPFIRGEARPSQHGLGLGLHIASEIAKAHGGQLSVTSTPEQTSFTFTASIELEPHFDAKKFDPGL